MKRLIELNVNGELYEVAIQQHRTLAEVLREELDLIGTKEACNEGIAAVALLFWTARQ